MWADTAYRSAKNEAMLAQRGFVSRIHRKKPKGKPMPERTRSANAQKSKVRSAIEHVFAHQKGLLHLTIRTIGLARAHVKIGLANLAYNLWTPPAQGVLVGFGGIRCVNVFETIMLLALMGSAASALITCPAAWTL